MAIVGTGPLGFSPNLRHRLEASAPKGLHRSPLQFGHLQRFLTAARLGFNISGGGGLNH
jgi:hypothetical protein